MNRAEYIKLVKPLLVKAGSDADTREVRRARHELAKALELPLRQGVMAGNIIDGIFERIDMDHGTSIEYPLDFVAPGTEKDYRAFTIPRNAQLPQLHVNGDYVTIPTYEIGAVISMGMHYARDAGWFVLERAMGVLESMIVKKRNDDGWHILLASAVDRNIRVNDTVANTGQFTKRVVSLAKTVMRRNGGGNSTSVMRGRLTDLFTSPEAQEDMRNWGVDIIDEVTRREIYLADENSERMNRIFGVNLHDIDELGEDQEYQLYYENELGASLADGDVEMLLGLDLFNNDSFVMPVKSDVVVLEMERLYEQRQLGWMAIGEYGYAALDNRRAIVVTI